MKFISLSFLESMRKNLSIELTFLFVVFCFAICKSTGYTIAWGLLPFFVYFLKQKEMIKWPSKKNVLIIFFLFATAFLLNLFAVYNFVSGTVEIPHPDFQYYLKIAAFFNETGIENNFTAKTILFDNINIATPYRFFDTWLLSLFMSIVPFDGFLVQQLIYLPFLWLMVTYSMYQNLDFVKNNVLKITLAILFLFFLGDCLSNYILSQSVIGEVCVVSYPKLAIFFCVFIYFFRTQLSDDNPHHSIVYLAILPILIQTAFPIYIFIYVYILLYYKYFLNNKGILYAIVVSTLFFAVYYGFNMYLSKQIFEIGQFQYVKNLPQFIRRFASIVYNVIKSKLILFIIATIILAFLLDFNKRIRILKMLGYGVFIVFSGALVYAFFPSSPNSYQLMTNFINPIFVVILFLVWIFSLESFKKQTYKLNIIVIILISIFGAYNQYSHYGFFNVKSNFTSMNNSEFVENTKQMLQNIKNPIGITYWSKLNKNRNLNEHFDQYGTNFLIKLSSSMDVVCLTALQNNDESFSEKVSNHYSALDIYKRLQKDKSSMYLENFYHKYKFEYLISDLSKDMLPDFIKEDVVQSTYDKNSKNHCYKLKPN